MSKVTVYTKNNCMYCNFTKKYLTENNIPFETKNVENDENALKEVKDLGFSSLPVVSIEGQEPFTGFKPNKLEQLKTA